METSNNGIGKNNSLTGTFYFLARTIANKNGKAHKALADWTMQELLFTEEGLDGEYNCLKISVTEKECLVKVCIRLGTDI